MEKKLQKEEIRKKHLSHRVNHHKPDLDEISLLITQKLEKLEEFRNAKNILLYIPIKNEVNTLPLIQKYFKKKKILIPKVETDNKLSIHHIQSFEDLETGSFGIPEAKADCEEVLKKNVKLAIIPGVAFDHQGLRIGYGKGYYDRLIKDLSCPKIALAYDFQILKELPAEIHDEKVNLIITESRILTTTP